MRLPTQRIAVAALILSGVVPPVGRVAAAGRDPSQGIFRDARAYTVRVRTEITTPFAEDARGAFQGAGFVVDAARGWILTNAHVVGQSPSVVHVAFADGPWRPARKIYVDSFTDVAILAIDAPPGTLRQASLDGSDALEVGESVRALWHPPALLVT